MFCHSILLVLLSVMRVSTDPATIPDFSNCEAWLAYEGPETPTLMVVPDGSGPHFTEAMLPDGTVVDCTVYLRLLNWDGSPIPYFPREDMWLESADGGLVPCMGGTRADVNTDQDGLSWWQLPSRAGGHSQAGLEVQVMGENIANEGLNLSFNSPDISGDLEGTIHDVALFAQDFFGEYAFRSDLHRDGVLNLSDIGRLIQGLGSACP